MNYIKRAVIDNFQSHLHSELEFDKGMNVIVGPTDNGKSVIIRAIKWALFNVPRGTDFMRYGSNSVRVVIEMSNGYTITRERSSSKNRYLLTDSEGVTVNFEGFGNDIPEEIKKAHGINDVFIDEGNSICLNISNQLEGAFLLSSTDTLKSKAIGTLTGVNIIDKAIKDVNLDQSSNKQTLKRIDEELISVNERLENFKDLDKKEKLIFECEYKLKILMDLVNKIDVVKQLKIKFEKVSLQIVDNEKILSKFKDIALIEKKVLELESLKNRNYILKNIKERNMSIKNQVDLNEKFLRESNVVICIEAKVKFFEDCFDSLKNLKKLKTNFDNIDKFIKIQILQRDKLKDVDKLTKSISSLDIMLFRLGMLKDLFLRYKDVTGKIKTGREFFENRCIEINNYMNEYQNLFKKLGKCPLCFSNIDDNVLEHIVKHV